MSKRLFLLVALGIIIASSAGIVTMISAQEGLAGASRGPGATPRPMATPEARWAPDQVYRTGSGTLWRVSYTEGVLSSATTARPGRTGPRACPAAPSSPSTRPSRPWSARSRSTRRTTAGWPSPPPRRCTCPRTPGPPGPGSTLKEPLRPNDQLTCVALSPHGSAVAVGTSFHGFFETSDRGGHWIDLSERVAAMQLGGGNYEEVASVAYSPVDPDLVYFSLGFGKGLFAMRRGTRAAERVVLPAGRRELAITDIAFREAPDGSGWLLEVRTDAERWTLRPETGAWRLVERLGIDTTMDAARAARRETASGRVGHLRVRVQGERPVPRRAPRLPQAARPEQHGRRLQGGLRGRRLRHAPGVAPAHRGREAVLQDRRAGGEGARGGHLPHRPDPGLPRQGAVQRPGLSLRGLGPRVRRAVALPHDRHRSRDGRAADLAGRVLGRPVLRGRLAATTSTSPARCRTGASTRSSSTTSGSRPTVRSRA